MKYNRIYLIKCNRAHDNCTHRPDEVAGYQSGPTHLTQHTDPPRLFLNTYIHYRDTARPGEHHIIVTIYGQIRARASLRLMLNTTILDPSRPLTAQFFVPTPLNRSPVPRLPGAPVT